MRRKEMDKKTKFLVILFLNKYFIALTFPSLLTLAWCAFIILTPEINIAYYITLIVIIDVLIYLILRKLYRRVDQYIKLINESFNFLGYYFWFIYFFTLFSLFYSIINTIPIKSLSYKTSAYYLFIPGLTVLSLLFFLAVYLTLREINLSESKNKISLIYNKHLNNERIERMYVYTLFTCTVYSLFFFWVIDIEPNPFVRNINPTAFFIFAIVAPIILISGVVSFIEATTFYVREIISELEKLKSADSKRNL